MNGAELIGLIRASIGITDPTLLTDALCDSFIREAESKFNNSLRIDWMVEVDTGSISTAAVAVPSDWLATDYLGFTETGAEIEYLALAEFNRRKKPAGYHTVVGRRLLIGGNNTDGLQVDLNYFREVPRIEQTSTTWLSEHFPTMYLDAALIAGFRWSQEYDRSMASEARVDKKVGELNNQYLSRSAQSGTLVKRNRRRIP